MSQEQQQEFQMAFRQFADGQGNIKVQDLPAVMRELGQKLPPPELDKLARQIAQGGIISFNSFCAAMSGRVATKESYEDVVASFKVFDKEGTGFIQASELKFAMGRYGEAMSERELDEMINDADPDNGWINYEEFARMITSV